jgi:hypothetical protein
MSPHSPTSAGLIQRRWKELFVLAAWLVGATASFLTFPLELSHGTTQGPTISGFTQTLIAIACGLTLIFVSRRAGSPRWKRSYFAISVACFAVFVVVMLGYVVLYFLWTCTLGDQLYVIGATPSAEFAKYLASPAAQPGCTAHLAAFQGNTLDMYDRAELILRFVGLAATYMLAWALLAILVVLMGLGLGPSGRAPRTRAMAKP